MMRYEPIAYFLHHAADSCIDYLHIETTGGLLVISSNHMLPIVPSQKSQDFSAKYHDRTSSDMQTNDHMPTLEPVYQDNATHHDIPFSTRNGELFEKYTTTAEHATRGSFLLTSNGTARILSVRKESSCGLYAPVTASGRMMVDGFQVSCYANVNNQALVHVIMSVLKNVINVMGVGMVQFGNDCVDRFVIALIGFLSV